MIKPFWKKFALVYFVYFMVQVVAVWIFETGNWETNSMPLFLRVLYLPMTFLGVNVMPTITNLFGNYMTEDTAVLMFIFAFFLNAAVYAFAIMGVRILWLKYKPAKK